MSVTFPTCCHNRGVANWVMVVAFSVFAILAGSSCHPSPADVEAVEFKTVSSRNGQVSFQIPNTWVAQPEDTHMMYYDPKDDSATLRLSVLIFDTGIPGEEDKGHAKSADSRREPHAQGGYLSKELSRSEEGGVPIVSTTWKWERRSGNYATVAIFTYTQDVDEANGPRQKAALAMIERAIRSAKMK